MMHTRCPACTTMFRFTPEQAKARHGKVRCGRCQHVFDAIEYLVDAAPVVAPAAPAIPATAPTVAIAPEPVVATPVPAGAPAAPLDTHSEPGEIDSPTAPSDEVPAAARKAKKSSESETVSPLSAAYLRDVEKARVIRWPWVLASLLAAVALLVQGALAWRVELATRYPQLRDSLTQLCIPFECEVGLPFNVSLLKIETSDLHPVPQKKGQFELVGTLRNYAPYAQVWPHLELTLTDGADRPIVRKVLTPENYLGNPALLASGFPAQGEFAVQVQLDAGQLPAAGYRLYLFYP